MLILLLLAAFLLAHGLIHASFLAPRPAPTADGPSWPFDLDRSWLLSPLGVPPAVTRLLGTAFVALTIGAFALAAVVALGVLDDLWVAAALIGAVSSLGVLGLFYRPWLTLGIVIDAVLLWAVLVAGFVPGS
jgi:hypothetical protein